MFKFDSLLRRKGAVDLFSQVCRQTSIYPVFDCRKCVAIRKVGQKEGTNVLESISNKIMSISRRLYTGDVGFAYAYECSIKGGLPSLRDSGRHLPTTVHSRRLSPTKSVLDDMQLSFYLLMTSQTNRSSLFAKNPHS